MGGRGMALPGPASEAGAGGAPEARGGPRVDLSEITPQAPRGAAGAGGDAAGLDPASAPASPAPASPGGPEEDEQPPTPRTRARQIHRESYDAVLEAMNDALMTFRAFKLARGRGGPRARGDWGASVALLGKLAHALETLLDSVGATDRLMGTMHKLQEVTRAVLALASRPMGQEEAARYAACLESQIRFHKASILYLRQLFRV